ncbi:hypothetical protein [Lactiplantibacillus plantarum]|uniref:hypothetical protein n=1 Tax=Lactiplantibacillus plantarum TaxID=1590 RepID=UPI0008262695|nr:hypothetical protein [Lactiplantibacillus plantarum]QXI72649.1 hypothetical protein JKL54_14830 [Lactiplantibacillus plantarum]QXI72671.1 hypothetical protein JKL54_14770 [Lactiplantibacillus plantarum]
MAGINDEKEYMFEGKNFYGIIAEKEINIDGYNLTIPFYFNKKDDLYNIIAGLPSKYPYIYNNQSYVLKDVKEKGKSEGRVEESTNPNYIITLHFERN